MKVSAAPQPAPDVARPTLPALGLMLQRECSCGTCEECSEPRVSRAPDPDAEPESAAGWWLVEDDTADLMLGQMRQSEFLDTLQESVCSTANAVLAPTGRTADDCPYIEYWIGYYRARNAAQVERALHRYAPESAGADSAAAYIPFVNARLRSGIEVWAQTGAITGVPEVGPEPAAESADDPTQVQSQLHSGRPLESEVRQRMESAFQHDFSHVRVHTDTAAARLSTNLSARAFAVGDDVAFAEGEYRPGSMMGDALLAHELAHTMQQSGGGGIASYDDLEADADRVAADALGSLAGMSSPSVAPKHSGLTLQRCRSDGPRTTKTLSIDVVKLNGATRDPAADITYANNVYRGCNVQFSIAGNHTATTAQSNGWLGGDTDIARGNPNCPKSVAQEEIDLFDGASAAFSLSSRFRAFYAASLTPAARATSYSDVCVDASARPYVNHLIVTNTADDRSCAHELGHILLDSTRHTGEDDRADTNNLMVPSNTATGDNIDATQCNTIYGNA